MISRTPTSSPRRRLALASVLALGGFALAFATTSTASAQEASAPSDPAPAATASEEGAAAPAATTTEDEEAKKKAAADAAATAPATTPAPAAAAPASGSDSSVTVSFGTNPDKKDEPAKPEDKTDEPAPKPNPWRGSMLILDQSMATRTFSKDSQLSYQPTYEWWISPRLFYTAGPIRLGLRQDVFKEWTNTKETTDKNEWEYTDTWLSASFRTPLKFISDHLVGSVTWTLRPGISKASRAAGQYMSTGPGAALAYSFPLAGENAKFFRTANVSATFAYWKAFTRCNVACGGLDDFSQAQQNPQGQAITSNQLRPGALPGSMAVYTLNAGVEIFDHFDYSASMIWFSQFANDLAEARLSDGTVIPRSENDTRLRQGSWFFTQFSYGVTKELTLAAGYWNSNTVLDLKGNYRNPFWSPEARVFFDVYVHLDAVYDRFMGGDGQKAKAGSAGRVF